VIASLRAARRLALAAPVTLFCWGWAAAASLALAPWPRAKVRQQGHAFGLWSRALCSIFGIRVGVSGRPPKPPFFLVSNHLSYADILVLGTEVPCVFVAKAEIDHWPLFGALCRSVNTIYIDRKAKRDLPGVLDRIRTALDAGQGVVIFPEGTSGPGAEVMPFRSPLLDLPARLGHEVHWAALGYRVPPGAPPAHLAVGWWGDMPLVPHLGLFLRLKWIEALVHFGEVPIADDDRKQLADRLWRAIAERFEPMVTREEVERVREERGLAPDSEPRGAASRGD